MLYLLIAAHRLRYTFSLSPWQTVFCFRSLKEQMEYTELDIILCLCVTSPASYVTKGGVSLFIRGNVWKLYGFVNKIL